jgi:hypothetical protein
MIDTWERSCLKARFIRGTVLTTPKIKASAVKHEA